MAQRVNVRNWGREVLTRPTQVITVRSHEAIQEIVRDPATYPSPVRAVGSCHSTTKCIDADGGTMLDMTELAEIHEPDEENLRITVGAGARYIDISEKLEAEGLMLFVNTEIGNLTAGAACVGQTKDSSFPGEYGQVSSYVYGVKMILADGSTLTVDEDCDPGLMHFVRCSYGMLGVVYEVTFNISPLRLMKMYHKVFTLDGFLENLEELRSHDGAVMYYMLPFSDRIAVECRSYHGETVLLEKERTTHKANKELVPYGSDWQFNTRNLVWKLVGPFMASVAKAMPLRPIRRLCTKLLDTTTLITLALLAGYNILPSQQTIHYSKDPVKMTQYTFSIFAFDVKVFPRVMREYFTFVRNYYKRTGWECVMPNVGYRLFQDKRSYLSYSPDGEVFTLDPVTIADDGWYPFLKEYNEFCYENGGKPLLNQTPLLRPEHCEQAFGPQLVRFNEKRRQLDPNNRFLSGFFRDLLKY